MESGLVQLFPRVDVSTQVEVEPVLAKQLSALALTDVGMGGEYLESPDPILHLLYALAVGEAVVSVKRVVFTEAGPTLQLESWAPAERVNRLYEEVAKELKKLGVVVGVRELRLRAKTKAVKTIGEYAGEVKRIAREAKSVEEIRARLIELFDRVMREAADEYRRTGSEGALWRAVGAAAAKKFFAENVDDPVWWALLLLGDGFVGVREHVIGFVAKPAEAAEAVMYVFTRVMGVPLEVTKGRSHAYLSRDASRAAVKELFKRLEEARVGGAPALRFFTAVAEWWLRVGIGSSDPPKLLSFPAFRELAAGKEGKWLGTWLSYETMTTPVPERVALWLDGVYRVSVELSRDPLTGAVAYDAYFERGGGMFKLRTDFSYFHLYCESSGEAAGGVLKAVARALGVMEPRLEGDDSDKKRLVLPADVGWPMFLRLWKRYNMSYPISDGDRELLRVEVLDAKLNGEAKFRIWFYKWRETRPDQPYVDFEVKPYWDKIGIYFKGRVYASEAKGILREHLDEIEKLLKREGVEGVAYYEYEKSAFLQFTGTFRDSILGRLGIRPELPPGEPPAVEYLGGFKFKMGDREVEFGRGYVKGGYEFYAELKFPSRDEAERFAKSLKAINVAAEVVGSEKAGYAVMLDSDAFFGLLAAANAAPPGLTLLYSSNEGDFRVYASAEEGRMRFYFAVRQGGVWKAAEGVYKEGKVKLIRAKREVLEAIGSAVTKAIERLVPHWQGRQADVEEPKEIKDAEGNIKGYYLYLYGPHLKPFLENAAETVKAQPAEVRLEGRRIVISSGDVKAEVEFKLLKGKEAEFLPVKDVAQTLALYKSLKEVGVRVEITPGGVKVDGEAMWALVATAVERSTPSITPAEVVPGVELLNVHSAGGVKMYIFRVSEEGLHYYFAVTTREGWRAAGGKYNGRQVQIADKAAVAIAEAINALYSQMGVERRIEVRYGKDGTPYIQLTNVDLELLDIRRESLRP